MPIVIYGKLFESELSHARTFWICVESESSHLSNIKGGVEPELNHVCTLSHESESTVESVPKSESSTTLPYSLSAVWSSVVESKRSEFMREMKGSENTN